MTAARWFTIRRADRGYVIRYQAETAEASGVYRTRSLEDACDLTVALKRLDYTEVQ